MFDKVNNKLTRAIIQHSAFKFYNLFKLGITRKLPHQVDNSKLEIPVLNDSQQFTPKQRLAMAA